MLRIAYLLVYAAAAALGEALVARPAFLWWRSQGVMETVAAWEVPMGAAFLALAGALALATLGFSIASALGKRLRPAHHAALLILPGLSLWLRAATPAPMPPRDPVPSLLAGLRAAADQLDATWAGRYAPDAAVFASSFAGIPPTGFRRLFRPSPVHVRVLSGAEGPQLERLEGDEPGTLYVAISRDRSAAWLTALGLRGVLALPSGQPALIEARAGSHSLVGRDPLVPAYPRMRGATR